MNLVRLIYTSRFAKQITTRDLQAILESSRSKNPNLCITGVLCYSPGCFLQAMEGPRKHVNELYRKIINDDRNLDVVLLDYSEVEERRFSDWSMAYISTEMLPAKEILRFSSSRDFNPFEMSAGQALGFLTYMLETQSSRPNEMP